MTKEEAVRKLEYSKTAYQRLIDEKVDSGKLVGKNVKGEWKADTPLDEAYKSMIDALEVGIKAIKALEQEPCDDMVSRDMALEKMADYVASGYADSVKDFEEYSRIICQLPPVNPAKTGHWKRISIDKYSEHAKYWYKCDKCGKHNLGNTNFCPNCGAKMAEPQESEG